MSDRALLLAVALTNRHGVESFEGDAANELRRLLSNEGGYATETKTVFNYGDQFK